MKWVYYFSLFGFICCKPKAVDLTTKLAGIWSVSKVEVQIDGVPNPIFLPKGVNIVGNDQLLLEENKTFVYIQNDIQSKSGIWEYYPQSGKIIFKFNENAIEKVYLLQLVDETELSLSSFEINNKKVYNEPWEEEIYNICYALYQSQYQKEAPQNWKNQNYTIKYSKNS